MLEKDISKKVHLRIEEIKVPEIDAKLIAESMRNRSLAAWPTSSHEACSAAGDAAVARRASRSPCQGVWEVPNESLGDRDGRSGSSVDTESRY
jgi:hypothetical protein